MQGIGAPFQLAIGRDPTAFEKFKVKQTHGGILGRGGGKGIGALDEATGEQITLWGNIAKKTESQYAVPLMEELNDPNAPGYRRGRDPITGEYFASGRQTAYRPQDRYITQTFAGSSEENAVAKDVSQWGRDAGEQSQSDQAYADLGLPNPDTYGWDSGSLENILTNRSRVGSMNPNQQTPF